jgi:hypothetical protein
MLTRFYQRQKIHDEGEEQVMNLMRPYTDRRHLPDRWVSFNGKIHAWDFKTNIFVEKDSHDEYFRVLKQDNIPVFIVYCDKGQKLANFIQSLNWEGPFPPSLNSTNGDQYYRISGGIPLAKFLREIGRKS